MNKVALFAILGTAMFLLSGATAFAATPSSATVHIQPNPTLNTNITWSTFYNGWNPLEYSNGTANQTLNAQPSEFYQNPITVNASAIQSSSLHQEISSTWWNNSANWWIANGGYDTVTTVSNTTTNGEPSITIAGNASALGATEQQAEIPFTWSQMPSQNLAYDYISITGYTYGTSVPISTSAILTNQTSSGAGHFNNFLTSINESAVFTQNGNSMQRNEPFFLSTAINAPNVSLSTSTGISIGISLSTPEETSTPLYITITGMAITTYPLTLGETSTGGEHAATGSLGNSHLTTLNPSFPWTKIQNGYSVAVSQPLQNLTTQQNAISSGNYIEQVEYQGQFNLPTAPDLSYGSANLTEAFNISTTQTQVLDINGVSYLSTISGKNGTVQLLSSVSPNSQTQFLQIVDYTQSQWNSISVAPGIFTIAGIEYYWWIAVGGLATLIGLAAAARHAGTKADQEKIRRGR